MKRTVFGPAALAAGVMASTFCGTSAQAQSADALLDKLVDKGILTSKEAKELREESDAGFRKAYQVKSGMPDWVTSLKINGDLRLRHESIYAESGNFADRSRLRYRLRPSITATIQDQFEVGFRLTSGEASGSFGGDPISGNTSYSDNGSKKFIYIDTAYAKWSPKLGRDWSLSLTGGKMENPFHFPGTAVFDKDYTPEGFAQELTYRLNEKHTLKLTGGEFALDELETSGKDPALLAAQLRWTAAWTPHVTTTVGGSYLSLINRESLTTLSVPNQGRGNTRTAGGDLVYGYNMVVLDGGATYTLESAPLYAGKFPITIAGSFMDNVTAQDDHLGWNAGLTLGKAGKRGTWQLDYLYTHLDGDVWFEELPESDFGAFYDAAPTGGSTGYRYGTNVKGHWVKGSYSPTDALTLSVAFFATSLVEPNPSNSESGASRLQIDAVLKF